MHYYDNIATNENNCCYIPGVPKVFPKTRALQCMNRVYYHYDINGIILCMAILLPETLYLSVIVLFSTG